MKQNKLKMPKLTEDEKKALAKQYRNETISDLAVIILAFTFLLLLALFIGGAL